MDVGVENFEYYYDETKQEYVEVAKDPYLKRRLQEHYHKLTVYDNDYYIAWLSMRPGQEAKLRLQIEALNADPIAADSLTFGPHASYQVTVNGQVNEAIHITPTATQTTAQFVDITIKCLHPCTGTELHVFDENRKKVGQLNVVDNTKTYRLPIRVIYLVKQGAASSTDLANLKSGFAALNLKKYLNENSLNQAQIQVDFENTNQSFELMFDEDAWAKEGFFDKSKNWFTDRVYTTGETPETKKKKTEYITEAFRKTNETKYEKPGQSFRGILVFMTNILFDDTKNRGGVSQTYPEEARTSIIFQSNLSDADSYAHEIGHALGLEHTFWEAKEQADFAITKRNIHEYKSFLENSKQNDVKNKAALKTNTDLVIKHNEEEIRKYELAMQTPGYPYKKSAIEYVNARKSEIIVARGKNEEIIKYMKESAKKQADIEERIKSMLRIFKHNLFKWKINSTSCIMDYSKKTNCYYSFQWNVMQQDIIHFYGKVEK